MENTYTKKIISLYSDYITWSAELMRSFGGVKIFSQLFTGGGQYKNRAEHEIFFNACGEAAAELAAAMEDGLVAKEELLELLRFVLVDCHEAVDEWGDWMLLASEKHFVPIVDSLSREEAMPLYEPYRRLRRKNKGLPPQYDILKTLKALCK